MFWTFKRISTYKQGIKNGNICYCESRTFKSAWPCLQYISKILSKNVYADAPGTTEEVLVFNTKVTFVRVNEQGKKYSYSNFGVSRKHIFFPAVQRFGHVQGSLLGWA